MARRAKETECKKGAPLWMATFSDLVTLMLAFFVMLVAMANFEDTKKIKLVIESLQEAFGAGQIDIPGGDGEKTPETTPDQPEDAAMEKLIVAMMSAMQAHVSDDVMTFDSDEQELRIRLKERVFFKAGSADLLPASYGLLGDVAEAMTKHNLNLRVEGFTDGQGGEEKNWRLSTERALAVVMKLRRDAEHPVPGWQLQVLGQGSFHPGVEMGQGEAWDRRVELVVWSNDASGADVKGILQGGDDHG